MLHALVEGDRSFALSTHRVLDGTEHVLGREPELIHVGTGHEEDLELWPSTGRTVRAA